MTFPKKSQVRMGSVVVLLLVMVVGLVATAAPAGGRHRGRWVYEVTRLETPEGASSSGLSLNNRGWAAGHTEFGDGSTIHATLWKRGRAKDLGTLGGPNSAVLWPVKSERMVVGIAETGETDPHGEEWSCDAFFPGDATGHVCRGFVWEKGGEMEPLGTLGGIHSFATGANRRGQVVGWAETEMVDDSCIAPQKFQFLGVVWDTRRDSLTELPPLTDEDSTTAATAINDRGQVVGISGDCGTSVGGYSARHAVMWERGRVKDLGSLGGDSWNTPMAINLRGHVVGFAQRDGAEPGAFDLMAFRWTDRSGMETLGTIGDDTNSQALGVNTRGQVVGLSCGERCRGFVWWGDELVDLNDITPGFDDHVSYANDINDRGDIVGGAIDTETGENYAFVAKKSFIWSSR